MADKRIDGLTIEPVLSFDQKVAVDKAAYSEAKGMTYTTLLRTRVKTEVDETGSASGTIDFTNSSEVVVTIDQDYQGSFTGIQDNEVVYLHVIKGLTDVFTPYRPVTGAIVKQTNQQNVTHLIYRITTNTTAAAYASFIVDPINSQTSGGLAISKFSVAGATITSLDHFNYTTNYNICNFSGQFNIQATSTISTLTITITDWDLISVYTNNAADVYVTSTDVSGLSAMQARLIDTNALQITLNNSLTATDAATVIFNGQIKIE